MLANFGQQQPDTSALSYEILHGLTYHNPQDGRHCAFITLDARQSSDRRSNTCIYHYGQSLADWQTGRSVDTQAIGNTVASIQRYIDYYIQPSRVPSFFTQIVGISPQSLFEQLKAAIELFDFIHHHEDIRGTSINTNDPRFLNEGFGNDFDHQLKTITTQLSHHNKQTLHDQDFPAGWLLNCFLEASTKLNPSQYNGSQEDKASPTFQKSRYKDEYKNKSQQEWHKWLPKLS